jgi:hypothetical protein
MLALDVLYTALATIGVMVVIQVVVFFVTRTMIPPEPRIIYREVQVPAPISVQAPVLTHAPQQEVKLPEYEPRQQASDSLRLDVELPAGLQETRPPGT